MSPLRHIQLLSIDLDGTLLLPGGLLGERTISVLRALLRRGVKIVLNSGRTPGSVAKYAETLGLEGPQAALNGAVLFEQGRPSTIFPVPSELRETLIALLHKYQLTVLYFGEHFGTHPDLPESFWKRWVSAWGYETLIDTDAFGDRPILHLQGLGSKASTQAAAQEINERFAGILQAWEFPSWFDGPHAVDIAAFGVDKGSALRHAAHRHQVEMAQTLACGDWINDLPMFTVAGASVAMVHATDDIKGRAHFVTEKSHQEEGLADFLGAHWEVP